MPYIYQVYTQYIPSIYLAYDHLCCNPGVYIEKTLWVCSVPVTYPYRHVMPQGYPWHITCLYGYVTGTEQTHKVFSMYTPGLRHTWSYTRYISGICHVCTFGYVYDKDIPSVFLEYYKYILMIFQEKYISGANWVCWASLSRIHNACEQ